MTGIFFSLFCDLMIIGYNNFKDMFTPANSWVGLQTDRSMGNQSQS